jgi:signal transduction histidine kinase
MSGIRRARTEAARLGARPEIPRTETALLRRTRWRLMAWSGGTTLLVLLVLGAAIYVAASRSLAETGKQQLLARVEELAVNKLVTMSIGPPGAIAVTSDPSRAGVVFGGEASGTLAQVMPLAKFANEPGMGLSVVSRSVEGGDSTLITDAAMLAAVASGQTVIREISVGNAPFRVLATPIPTPQGMYVAVVLGDRTSEVGTLQTLLAVLLGGGLLVLAASLGLGYVYAGRALVPIRESLRRQREFAADASHELRTPLTITRAAIAELRRGRTDPATVDRVLDDLDAGTARIEHLVGDLLLLARTDAEAVDLEPVPTDLANLAAEATESLEPVAAARGIRLVLDVEPSPLAGDEVRLRQLVAILVDNAIRHTPDHGRVTVAVRPGAQLSVEDEGRGLHAADVEHIFERFWRAPDAPAGGTGLGLAIARWIVERHRGTISAGNRAKAPGARFVVRLPAG